MSQRDIAQRLMGSDRIVVGGVSLHDVVKMPKAEAEQFSPGTRARYLLDPQFGVGEHLMLEPASETRSTRGACPSHKRVAGAFV